MAPHEAHFVQNHTAQELQAAQFCTNFVILANKLTCNPYGISVCSRGATFLVFVQNFDCRNPLILFGLWLAKISIARKLSKINVPFCAENCGFEILIKWV